MTLRPEMASLKLQVWRFIRDYHAQWKASPSYGEIIAGTGSTRSAVRHAVRQLVAEGRLIRVPGPRGLHLPSACEAALRALEEAGYVIDREAQRVEGPYPTLMPPAELTYPEPEPCRDPEIDDRTKPDRKSA